MKLLNTRQMHGLHEASNMSVGCGKLRLHWYTSESFVIYAKCAVNFTIALGARLRDNWVHRKIKLDVRVE